MADVDMNSAAPKYALVERAILDAIEDGRYAPGSQIPGERALAESLGVAPMTLRQGVNRLVGRGVLERRQRVGTFVRRRMGASNVALLVFHADSASFNHVQQQILNIIRDGAAEKGAQVRGMLMLEPYPSAAQLVDELHAMDVGAIGLLGFLESERSLIESLAHLMPSVFFVKDLPGIALPTAKHDIAAAADAMVAYFAERGRKRVALGALFADHPMHLELTYAVRAALTRHRLPIDGALWAESLSMDKHQGGETMEWIRRSLDLQTPPDAMIVPTTSAADYVVRLLAERGEKVGDRLDVIPIHSAEDPRPFGAPYPIMNLRIGDVAEGATRLLLEALDGSRGESAPILSFAPELVPPQGGPDN